MTITINGTTGIAGVDGSASTPAVQGTDTNTGIFFPAADTIAFGEGGAEVARFDSNGSLLIATTNAITGITGTQLTASNTNENPAYINIFRDDTTIGNGQFLGYLQFCGRDATSSLGTAHAYVASVAEADHGAGDNATAITFGTTPDNSSTISERARIDSSGNLLVGTTNMGQGVGVQVGEVGIDGVSGFGMTSAVSIADDATITLSANTGLLVFIEYLSGGVYPGAMFYCSYAAGVVLVTQSGGSFAATDSDGNACVFKSNTTDVVTVKNRLGGTRSYSIHTLQLRGL